MVAMTLKRVKTECLVASVMTQPISIITQQEKKGIAKSGAFRQADLTPFAASCRIMLEAG
jgi:hypothetical protein